VRHYWRRDRRGWVRDVERLLARASIVHAGLDDLYKALCFEAFVRAVRRGIPTIFVQDTDLVEQIRQRALGRGLVRRVQAAAYAAAFERAARWGVRRADLSLLKGRDLMNRYGRFARNAHYFLDTSHSERDILPEEELEARLAVAGERALRLVYCGRLVPRKGVNHSIQMVKEAAARGARVALDIIGDGPQREELVGLAAGGPVRFLGAKPYGPELLRELAGYDALLFTPVLEDTPRMVFDAYAAGLPFVGYDIGYLRERAERDRAGVLIPWGAIAEGAAILGRLARERGGLAGLSRSAREAARANSAEAWYRSRAEWTLEMMAGKGALRRRARVVGEGTVRV
jgi:glycosyltransferase involved in cell wall biosynthesis